MEDEIIEEPLVIVDPAAVTPEDDEDENEVDDVIDEVSDLEECIKKLEEKTGENFTELRTKVDLCLTKLEQLSTQQNPESPILAQMMQTLAEVRAELAQVKSSTEDLKTKSPRRRESSDPLEPLEPEPLTVEVSDAEDEAELPPETLPPPRRRRFV